MDKLWMLWVVLALTTIFMCFELSAFNILSIDPAEVEALVDKDFKVTCSAEANWTADDLQFRYVFKNGSQLSAEDIYLKPVNSSAVEFHPPGLTSEFHGSYVSCYAPNNESIDARVNLWEQHPLPRITFFEVWNWEELRFKWGFDDANLSRNMPTVFEGWYKDSNVKEFTKCEIRSTPNECSVRKSPAEIAPFAGNVHIKVNASNRLENISTDGILFPLSHRIRPGSVKSLNVRTVPENYSTCFANFRAPHQKSMTYNISTTCSREHYQLSKEETPLDFSQIKTSISVMLFGLPADANCTLSVNAIPVQGGFWGAVQTVVFKTLEAVPVAAPNICRSCFDLQMADGGNFRNVIVYFKPLPRELARGKVTTYKVQYMNSRTKWTQLLDSSSFLFTLQNLSIEDETRVTIEARTAVGFNETLSVPVLTIKMASLSGFRIERFVVIAVNETKVETSWESLSNASSYTLFWCPKKVDDAFVCGDVLNWIELPAIYSGYDILLTSGHHPYECLFGIAYSLNEYSSGIQWAEHVYDQQAVALPPSVELNASSAFELHLSVVRKSPSSRQNSGFIVNYVIYFCPISSEDDLECIDAVRQLTVDGWSSEACLSDLLPHQKYKILGESWTAAGRSRHNSTTVLTTSASGAVASWLIPVIVVVALICLAMVIVGLITIVRFSRRSVIRCKQWLTVDVTTPPGPTADSEPDKCRFEKGIARNSYSDVAASRHVAEVQEQAEETRDEQVEIEYNGAPFHMDISPIRRQGNLGDVPLFAEERLLPPISRFGIHGSSPSIMLHVDKSITSPEKQRILPSISGKQVYVRPLQRREDIILETMPMVLAGTDENLKENCFDVSDTNSTMSYAYARQRNSWGERLVDSLAAPVKFVEVPEESGNDYDAGDDDEGEEEEKEEEDELTAKAIDISEGFTSGKTVDSFEHLPSLLNSVF